MALRDDRFAICVSNLCAWLKDCKVRTKTHRAAHVCDITLIIHQVNDRVCRCWVKLCAVCIGETQDMPCILNRHHLHTQAKTKTWDQVLSRIGSRCNLSFNTALTKTARDNHSVKTIKTTRCEKTFDVFGLNPINLNIGSVVESCMLQTFNHREICIMKFDVLTDQPDTNRTNSGVNESNQRFP